MTRLLDYRLNRLFYDLHTNPALADEYRRDRAGVLARYPLSPQVVAALENDDVAALSPLTNGFLMRYYFLARGLPEQEFLAQIHAMRADANSNREETQHG